MKGVRQMTKSQKSKIRQLQRNKIARAIKAARKEKRPVDGLIMIVGNYPKIK